MKKNKNLFLYISGRFISLIGTGIQMVALPLFILDLTHSGLMMGIFSMLNLIPNVITAPFAGILGDRKNRKNLMIYTDFGRGILIGTLAVLAVTGVINIYMLFAFQIFISIMDSIFNASSGALLPELVDEEQLMQAMSLRGGLDGASFIVGPVFGGIIYGLFGIKTVFLFNAVSFLISGISSVFILYNKKTIEKGKISIKSFFNENTEILSFIKNNNGLLQLFSFCLISNLVCAPLFDVVMPYVLKKGIGFSSQQYGYLMAFFTLGILLGNIALGIYFSKYSSKAIIKSSFIMQTGVLLLWSMLVFPQCAGAFGGATWKMFFILALGTSFIGIFNAFVNTPIQTNLQKMVPNELRSRFFSVMGMFCQGAVPIGSMIYGILLDKLPYYYIMLAIALINALTVIAFIIIAVPEAYEPKITYEKQDNELDSACES